MKLVASVAGFVSLLFFEVSKDSEVNPHGLGGAQLQRPSLSGYVLSRLGMTLALMIVAYAPWSLRQRPS